LRVPLKIEEVTVENLKKAFYLFPPKSRGGQLMDFDAVAAEWEILCHQCTNTETLMQVMEKSTKLQKVLPWVNWLCRLAFTAPVTTAYSERTFSKLKLIKHSLRSTLSSDRLNSLMVLNCEKDLTDKIDINCVLINGLLLNKEDLKFEKSKKIKTINIDFIEEKNSSGFR